MNFILLQLLFYLLVTHLCGLHILLQPLFWLDEKWCRMKKLSKSRGFPCFWLPEGVHRYVERRSFFIAFCFYFLLHDLLHIFSC